MSFIKNKLTLALLGVVIFNPLLSQDLDELMKKAEGDKTDYTTATFKGTRIINGHSIEAPAKGVFQLMFSHRFGPLNDPVYTFFGLNEASVRFGFDFGITDRLAVGFGRSSGLGGTLPPPTYDFYIKYRLVTQSRGAINMPVSISILGASSIDTERWPDDGIPRTFEDRLYYTGQLLIARKFSEGFSLQLSPTIVHRNLTNSPDELNTLYTLGIGGRIKISKRMAITAEYYVNKPNSLGAGYYNPVAIGFDLETGGHVFQIQLTNSMGLIEPQFIGGTQTNFFDGAKAVRLGFNFTRVFNMKKTVPHGL